MEVPPTLPKDLVRLGDMYDFVGGKTTTPVRAIETSNIAGTYDPAGKTLTQATPTEFIIDGITLVIDDRVLVAGQTDKTQNGIYKVTTLGVTSGAAGVLTRADDFDESGELVSGRRIPIASGLTHGGETWKLTSADPLTLDASNLEFALDITKYTEIAQHVFTLTGDATTDEYTLEHNFNTRDVTVDLYDATSGDTVMAAVTRTSVNDVVVSLGVPLGVGTNLKAVVRAVVTPV
jgi:hypothetical protein